MLLSMLRSLVVLLMLVDVFLFPVADDVLRVHDVFDLMLRAVEL